MSSRPLPIFIDAHAVHGNILDWTEVSRDDAIRLEFRGAPVVVTHGMSGMAQRFDDQSPFWLTYGPYDYSQLRYFIYKSGVAAMPRASRGTSASAKPARKAEPQPSEIEAEPELVPLEKEQLEKPVKRASASPPAAKPKETVKKELRFDLALDPATPGLEDDVFVLSSGDGTYSVTRTVKDDKVPGDKKLSLIFPGVKDGQTYRLSQVQDGEETVLVPEVTYGGYTSGTASGPGEVVGCKVVFRECRIKGDHDDFYKEKESNYLIDLAAATGKWVYVFGGPQGKPFRLLAEGLGQSDGSFRPVDVVKQAGKNGREASKNSCAWMTLPLMVNGKSWDLHTCLSPVQLTWKRIEQLATRPSPRCYKVGAKEGGILWAPKNVGRDVPDWFNTRDSRVKDPGKDTVVIGLVDPMTEAKRRAGFYQGHVEKYLAARFDLPPADGKPVPAAEHRRKYTAGMMKVLLEQHPDTVNLRKALASNGRLLDTYLKEQDDIELDLMKKAVKAGAAASKWMDHPSGLFESALCDYTADTGVPQLWQVAQEDYAYLIRYFDVTSLTRKYSKRILERKDAWVYRYVLNEDAHGAAHKLTISIVEILSWLGKVQVYEKEFNLKVLEEYYRRFVNGFKLKERTISSLEYKSMVAEYFPDERTPRSTNQSVKYWQDFEKPEFRREIKVLWLDESTKPLEKLGKVADAKVIKALMYGLEGMNFILAARSEVFSKNEKDVARLGTVVDMAQLICESMKIAGRKAGRGVLSSLGTVSAAIDIYFAVNQVREDAAQADYDAMAAQIAVATGSASVAVGSSIVAAKIFSGLTLSSLSLEAIFTAGAGVSATGAGAPLGAILILAGIALVAGGSIAYLLAKDSELETWFKSCPFGFDPGWSFTDERLAPTLIRELSQRLFPWKVTGTHAFLNGQSDYRITIQGPLSPYTKINILALDFMDRKGQKTRFLQGEILRPVESRNLRIVTTLQSPTSVSIFLKDSACWAAHKQRFPKAENGFTFCAVQIEVDQHGDGQILWYPKTEGKTLIFEV